MDGGTAPTGGGRHRRYRRAGAWLLVIAAVLGLEIALLGDRISEDLARLAGSAPDAPAAAPAARVPSPQPEPAASGSVSGVDLRTLDGCVPGAGCAVRLQVRSSAPGATEVVWRTRTEDLCTGARHESGERRVTVPPGGRIDVVTDVRVPAGAAVAVSPVVTSPAAVAGTPVVLPARPRCPADGPGR